MGKRKIEEEPQLKKIQKTSQSKPTTPRTTIISNDTPIQPEKFSLPVLVLRYVGPTPILLHHNRDVIFQSTIEITKKETELSLQMKIQDLIRQFIPCYQGNFEIMFIFCDFLCDTNITHVYSNTKIYSDKIYVRLTSCHDTPTDFPFFSARRCFEVDNPRSPAGADFRFSDLLHSLGTINLNPSQSFSCSKSPPTPRSWKEDPSNRDPIEILMEIVRSHLRGFINAPELNKTANRLAETAYFNWLDSLPNNHIGHMIIQGNPGTGKTTGAWAIAGFLAEAGIVRSNRVIEAHRDDLVGRFVGETEVKTNEVIHSARGGVVIFDEIYALNKPTSHNDYGKEALTTIMKYMTSEQAPVFMFLGYKNHMKAFVQMNPGFQRRIKHVINLSDYDAKTLANIAIFKMREQQIDFDTKYDFEKQFNSLPKEYVQLRNASVALELIERALAITRKRALNLPHTQRKGNSRNITCHDFDEAFDQIVKECSESQPKDNCITHIFA